MQVKCEVFSRFGSSVDFSSGEPLSGVEAPTVWADLCVRPSSPERSLFCGRTRRSAPTQATSARQFYSSNAVALCRDARLVRPLYQRLQRCGFDGDGRTSRASLQIVTRLVRPLYQRLQRCGFDGDGRTSRASRQRPIKQTSPARRLQLCSAPCGTALFVLYVCGATARQRPKRRRSSQCPLGLLVL